jgi:uncharacterized protein YebE (UPF0316 family)
MLILIIVVVVVIVGFFGFRTWLMWTKWGYRSLLATIMVIEIYDLEMVIFIIGVRRNNHLVREKQKWCDSNY